MQEPKPHLDRAFRLGRVLEELASAYRKQHALSLLAQDNQEITEGGILGQSVQEVLLTAESLERLSQPLQCLMPKRLVDCLQRLEKEIESGYSGLDTQPLHLIHAAIAGLIEEVMNKGTTWHCLQLGRLVQRAQIIMSTILDALQQRHMPDERLLRYLSIRCDCACDATETGTHLWKIHQVFQTILKVTRSPKSLESTFMRMGVHIESMPVPESLKKDHEILRMAYNRMCNDLAFVDVHEMIGDDPDERFASIIRFFGRQHGEIMNLISLVEHYLQSFENYYVQISDDEIFEVLL